MGAPTTHPTVPKRQASLAYIPALDGIRGVAMVVIMGFHGGVFLTAGGFYSLDTFFALSGFLITSLLIAEWQRSGTVRLKAFWARRARRLLPALLVMLVGVALYARFLVPPGTYSHLRADGLSSLFYYANWHFILIGSNYFDQTGLTSPLTHTWSLGVEEQFYILWPLIVLGTLKLWNSLRPLLIICVAGALASAVEMGMMYSPASVNRLYYGTDTRAQSLLVGAALAVALAMWVRRRESRSEALGAGSAPVAGGSGWSATTRAGRVVLAVVGLAGVGGTAALWTLVSSNQPFAYRGGFLVAALATAAVLLSVVSWQRSPLALCLSVAPVRYLGRISYGMYLWHFPLFMYIDAARTGLSGYELFALRGGATVVVATASFYLIEQPIRQGTFLRGVRARIATPAAFAATVAILVSATAAPAVAALPGPPPARPVAAGTPAMRVLLVGDSTALTLGIGLSTHESSYGVDELNGGILGCGVTSGAEYQLKGVDAPMASQCTGSPSTPQWPQIWRRSIQSFDPNVVMILVGRWEVANRTFRGSWTNILSPAYAAYVKDELVHAAAVAGSGGAHVVLMTAPCYDSGEQPDGSSWPEDSRRRLSVFNALVREAAAASANTSVLDFNSMTCPGGRYEEYMDGVQVRESDGVHFTFQGGEVFGRQIWPVVAQLDHDPMTSQGKG